MAETSASPIARIDTEQIREDVLLARVYGEIDLSSAPVLRSAVDSALETDCALVLDLDGVTFIGSSGLAVLVNTDRRVQEAGLRWTLVANNRVVSRALHITGLTRTLPIASSIDNGIAAVEHPIPQQTG